MSDSRDTPRRPVTIRARSAWVIFVLAAVVIVALAVDALARGTTGQSLAALAWMALILWAIYVVLFRPCVVVRPDGLHVFNICRRHELPWSSVETVESRYQLSITLTDGRRVTSWGAPTTAVSRSPLHGRDGTTTTRDIVGWFGFRSFIQRPTPSDTTRLTIEDLKEHWADGPEAVGEARSIWEWWSIVPGLVLVVLCVITVLVPR